MWRCIASDKACTYLSAAFSKEGNVRHEDDELLTGLPTVESITADIRGVPESANPHGLHLRALRHCAELSSLVHSLLKSSKPGDAPSLAGTKVVLGG